MGAFEWFVLACWLCFWPVMFYLHRIHLGIIVKQKLAEYWLEESETAAQWEELRNVINEPQAGDPS